MVVLFPVMVRPPTMVDEAKFETKPAFRMMVVEVATPPASGVQAKVPDPLLQAEPESEMVLLAPHSIQLPDEPVPAEMTLPLEFT